MADEINENYFPLPKNTKEENDPKNDITTLLREVEPTILRQEDHELKETIENLLIKYLVDWRNMSHQ